jgi:hypothetical protein
MKYILLLLSFTLMGSESPSPRIEVHKTEDIMINIPIGDEKLFNLPEILKELEDNHSFNQVESQIPRPKNCKERCIQNRTVIIAACATLASSTIAGTVALIVHFTAS